MKIFYQVTKPDQR